ncbi:MAG: hypothetical protein ACU84H_14910 [Gammaproteobacteria bacterium]
MATDSTPQPIFEWAIGFFLRKKFPIINNEDSTMKKTILALMLGAGMSTAALAGVATPGNIDCNSEHEVCVNGFEWEVSLKCDDAWDPNSDAYVNIEGETAVLDGETDDLLGDCRATLNLEGDDDVYKYEHKCALNNGTNKGGDKIELEIKNKGPAVCDPV